MVADGCKGDGVDACSGEGPTPGVDARPDQARLEPGGEQLIF